MSRVVVSGGIGWCQIEDCYRKTVSVDNVITSLDILDTAGQEDFSALRDQWVREGNAFVLVYAINSAQSFRDLDAFRERILLVNEEREVNAPIVLVGNKSDLGETERKVTVEEAEAKAAEWGNIQYFECSALNGSTCETGFHSAIRQVRKIEAAAKPKPSTSGSGGFWSICTIL